MSRIFTFALLLSLFFPTFAVQAQSGKPIESLSSEILFSSHLDRLVGTVTLPKSGNDRFPLVVFVHGSVPTTRSDRYYNYLSDYFLKQGVATFLYDKRGCGKSGGSHEGPADFGKLSDDVIAAVQQLKTIQGINPNKIGVIGTSQGGWIAPLAASKSDDISFVVTISGPGTTVLEQNQYQRDQELEDYGYTASDIADISLYKTKLYTYFGTGEGYEEINQLNQKYADRKWLNELPEHEQKIYPPSVINSHPAFKNFKLDLYDPKTVLEKVKIPFLALFGEKDRHIPVQRSIQRIKSITDKAKNDRFFTIKSFPNSGHLIQIVETEKEVLTGSKLTSVEEKIAYMTKFKANPEFINFLIHWVLKTNEII